MHLVDSRGSMSKAGSGGPVDRRTPAERLFCRAIEWLVALLGGTWRDGSGVVPRRMKVVETLSIGVRKQLLLVLCDGEKYLVATGPDTVQTIMRVESVARPNIVGHVAPERGERS